MSSVGSINVFYEWYDFWKEYIAPTENLLHLNLDSHVDKWELAHVDGYGRCLVAKDDLKEGEVLFMDHPLVTGPKQCGELLCLGCYKQMDEDAPTYCSKCGWPVCGEDCERKGYHPMECDHFTATGYMYKKEDFDATNPMFEAILPLRCLCLPVHYPERWRTFEAMEAHNDLRRGSELWESAQKTICDYLHQRTKITATDEEIHTAVGVLDVNCHEVRSTIPGTKDEYRVRGIYPLTAMMSHDCSSNTHHTVMDDMTMLVVASRVIPKGCQITGTYTHLLSGTIERRKHLGYGKYFDCACDRCKDPTELGIYFSALRCTRPNCCGNLLPRNPLDPTNMPDFICDRCSLVIKCGTVNRLTNSIYIELQNTSDTDPGEIEKVLAKYQSLLHPNHYHVIGMKHSLCQTYGRVEGYLLGDLTPAQLQRKVDCCRDILTILDVLDPGISRLRGLTFYELHAPILLRANRAFQAVAITKDDFMQKLNEALDLLNKTVYCLQYEPVSSFEGEICKIARKSSTELQKWINTVESLNDSRFLTVEKAKKNVIEEELTLQSLLKKIEQY